MSFRKRGKGFQPDSWCFTREMMAAPSCLCTCGARGGLAHVGHTCRPASARARDALAQVACTCRAGWARVLKISASCCASRSLRAPHGRGRAGERRPLRRHVSPVQQHLYAERAGIRLRQPCRCRRARGVQTYGSIPKPMLDKLGIDERLLRLSVGLENAEDLIADLEQAIG